MSYSSMPEICLRRLHAPSAFLLRYLQGSSHAVSAKGSMRAYYEQSTCWRDLPEMSGKISSLFGSGSLVTSANETTNIRC